MKYRETFFLLILLITQLAGCGGGGGGASVTPSRTALVTLSSAGTVPSGSLIGGIDIALNLPAGVTVKSAPSPLNQAVLEPSPGVITLLGGAAGAASQSLSVASYVPGTPGRVNLKLISASGLAPAEAFATVNCDIAAGSSPLPADFSVTANIAQTTGVFDLNGVALPNVSVQFSLVIK
jgi:hypothetical protein